MNPKPQALSHRWFIYSSATLMVVLFLAIILAGLLLLQRGLQPRHGIVSGSSMEPTLHGPRITWKCPTCDRAQTFGWDTWIEGYVLRCRFCAATDVAHNLSELDGSISGAGGESIIYLPLRTVRSARKKEPESVHHASGLRRGDIVVIRDGFQGTREIKRLVGFPNETIAIENGDLFVNGTRYQKTLAETLRQAIVVDQWSSKDSPTVSYGWQDAVSGKRFLGKLVGPIEPESTHSSIAFQPPFQSPYVTDELWCNAVDPFRNDRVSDIGVAFRTLSADDAWTLRIEWYPQVFVTIEKHSEQKHTHVQLRTPTGEHAFQEPEDEIVWWVATIADGQLIVGNQSHAWHREELDTKALLNPPTPTMRVVCESGQVEFQRLILFRDIHYRGDLGRESQTLNANPYFVVLGDNVSYSDDTRRRERTVDESMIRGVVQPAMMPLESLIQQADTIAGTSH